MSPLTHRLRSILIELGDSSLKFPIKNILFAFGIGLPQSDLQFGRNIVALPLASSDIDWICLAFA